MGDKMDLSLDDIIKMTKPGRGRGGGRGRGRGLTRGVRGGRVAKSTAADPRKRRMQSAGARWTNDKFTNRTGDVGQLKLLISNLDFGVNDNDIRELFSEFGRVRKACIHYDRSGRSLGTAEVFFERRQDALKAKSQYNGVPLDGRAMRIELIGGGGSVTPARSPRVQQGRGRGAPAARGRGGGGRGRGGRGGGSQRKSLSKEDLDAQLDKFVANNATAAE